jgi:hypothetical protein
MEIIRKCHFQFLGNHKTENYRDMVADLVIQSYKAMGCNMSLKF